MATFFVPPPLRPLAQGSETLEIPNVSNLREFLQTLASEHPDLAARVWDGAKPLAGLSIIIDDAVAHRGLQTPIQPESEVHILPAIAGG